MRFELAGETVEVPPGAVIGIVSDEPHSTVAALLASVAQPGIHRFGYTLDGIDACARLELHGRFESLRRAGEIALVATHNEELLRDHADEVWWIAKGRIKLRGSTSEVLTTFNRYIEERFRRTAPIAELAPRFRRGDGRAQLTSLDLLDANGERTSILASGAEATVRVVVRYESAVDDPVVGIMIRTRIGMEVYGTNTELEKLQLGPCRAGDVREVLFAFRCDLCPGRYTLTAASHDPDGVWHDWVEDAAAFTVTAERYTAGVANLRARVVVVNGSRE